MLARRLNGKYLAPICAHLDKRVEEIKEGQYEQLLQELMNESPEELRRLYNTRDIEK